MKKTIKKMSLKSETVRSLTDAGMSAAMGAGSADFTGCVSDGCNTRDACRTWPPNCVGTLPATNVRTCVNCTVA